MDIRGLRRLLTPAGQEVLASAEARQPIERDYLRHFQRLGRRFPPDLARAALETAILRLEAAAKFPAADRMYFTRESLEQSTSFAISSYRAGRFQAFDRVADLGCSIGGDTLALAPTAFTVALDHDPLRLMLAQANLSALGLADRTRLLRADLTDPLPLKTDPGLGLFFDPARREDHRRIYSVEAYRPPLQIVRRWSARFPAISVKVSPAVRMDELDTYDAEVEFISLRGELKEAVLWFGPLKSAHRRATVLEAEGGATQASKAYTLQTEVGTHPGEPDLPLAEPGAYLYEPDPAVLRAGLVTQLGALLGAAQLDPDIAYLTADQLQATPFARAWPVEDWFPFGLKRLRAYLRARNVGRLTVKKRGSPLSPEELIQKMRLKGDEERVIFLTHLQGAPIVVVGEQVSK